MIYVLYRARYPDGDIHMASQSWCHICTIIVTTWGLTGDIDLHAISELCLVTKSLLYYGIIFLVYEILYRGHFCTACCGIMFSQYFINMSQIFTSFHSRSLHTHESYIQLPNPLLVGQCQVVIWSTRCWDAGVRRLGWTETV